MRDSLQIILGLSVCFFSIFPIFGEQLPLKTYTVSDGLASNFVNHIYQDHKGFIWFATGEGLSRFDGYDFKNYDESDGLPPAAIRFITEDDKGVLWVGTFHGIARLNDSTTIELNKKQEKKFARFKISGGDSIVEKVKNQVSRILFDSEGNLWCLTDYGLYKATNPDSNELKFEKIIERDTAFSGGAFRDENGSLWFGLGDELFEIRGAEIINQGSVGIPFPKNLITAITRDAKGRLLVSDIKDLFEFVPERKEFRKIFTVKEGSRLYNVLAEPSGKVWLATQDGLLKIDEEATNDFRSFGGSSISGTSNLANDSNGNLWLNSGNNGVRRLQSESIVNFIPKRDDSKIVGDAFENVDGKIWAMLVNSIPSVIEDGELFEKEFDSPLPSSPSAWFNKIDQGWFYGTQNQMLKIKSPKLRLRNGQIIDVAKYLDGKEGRFFEDEQEVLWLTKDKEIFRGTSDGKGCFTFESFPLETAFNSFASRVIGDGYGGVWLTHPLFLGRFRNGEYKSAEISEGLPEKDPRSIFKDSRGWLWIGLRNKGVSMTKEPAADNPVFTNYAKTNSPLQSNAVRSITEDNNGRMYFATDNGVSRLNLSNNEWTHFSSKTGLAGDLIFSVIKDSNGFIWASTESGLSRIDSRLETKQANLPPIYITEINIAGKDLDLPETGLAEIPKIELSSSENNLTIGFVAPNFQDENLNYQYKLAENAWSNPSKERSVSFSNLSGGNYRFEVRVVNQNGVASDKNAAFEFQILPPIYLRWWFVLGVLGLIGLAVYWLYRFRVQKLLELERTRTRIATDLHDDIGTNLSKISLLSEIIKMQLTDENDERTRMLKVIGETSRESVGAMSDIVWTINPNKDSLADITRRMRQHAEEVFLEKGVSLTFNAPEDGKEIKLSMEIRRELYLIFKESVNNSAKHSVCKNVEIDFQACQNELLLIIKDDGKGFDLTQKANGNGLKNLQIRAERIKAKLEIQSEIGKGTNISVQLRNR